MKSCIHTGAVLAPQLELLRHRLLELWLTQATLLCGKHGQGHSISGLVVEYIVAIDVTRV